MITLAAAAFILTSATFKPNATMPLSTINTRCSGKNTSPELRWSGVPAGTKSFALIVHDPDAPHPGGWYHWVAYNLPARMRELPPGVPLPIDWNGKSSFGEDGYGGPCPPPGKPHHYNFTLYALDIPKIPTLHLTAPQLHALIDKHTLAKTTLTGLYGT